MNLLFGFSGRIGRLQWWLAQAVAIPVIIIVSLGIVGAFAHAAPSNDSETWGAFGNAGPSILVIVIAVFVLLVWINIASTVKRFHDRGKSGYWCLIVLVPYIGAIWQLVECGFLAGSRGNNNYGPPPGSGDSSVYGDLADEIAGYSEPQQRSTPVAAVMRATPSQTTQLRQPSPSRFGRRGTS
jgi:uncharacterized membrane protein YhaH (DUF805 family)